MCEPGNDPTLECKFRGHKDTVTALCFSPNEDQLVSSSLDSSLMVWKMRGTMRSYRFEGHKEAALDVAYSPSGKLLASVSRDRSVRLWLPSVTGSTGEFRAHSQSVRSVHFTSDSVKLITASDDKTIKLWSVARQKFISSFVGHTNWVRCARLSNDNSVIASCSDDKTLKLWNIDSGECIHTYTEQKGSGHQIAWHPSGCYVAIGLSNGTVKLYDTRTHSLLQHYRIHDEAVSQISFHPSGSYLLTCSKDNKMKILDLLEGHPVYTLTGHAGAVSAVTFSPDGDYFASGGEDKQVLIWKSNFTELNDDNAKENIAINVTPATGSETADGRKLNKNDQGANIWNRCCHSTRVPIGSYVQLNSVQEEPLECNVSPVPSNNKHAGFQTIDFSSADAEATFCDVGDVSHIPRRPPSPQIYTNPKVIPTSNEESILGMISLKGSEVCYTNGRIEWVGKRQYLGRNNEYASCLSLEPRVKKCKPSSSANWKNTTDTSVRTNSCECAGRNNEYASSPSLEPFVKKSNPSSGANGSKNTTDASVGINSCECADVIPTISTIVEHLNALHEAMEIVDERLNEVEGAID